MGAGAAAQRKSSAPPEFRRRSGMGSILAEREDFGPGRIRNAVISHKVVLYNIGDKGPGFGLLPGPRFAVAIIVEEVGARDLAAIAQGVLHGVTYAGVRSITGFTGAEVGFWLDAQWVTGGAGFPSGAGKAADNIHIIELQIQL